MNIAIVNFACLKGVSPFDFDDVPLIDGNQSDRLARFRSNALPREALYRASIAHLVT